MSIPLIGQGQSLPDTSGVSKEELAHGPRDTLLICGDCGTIEHIPGTFTAETMERNDLVQARLRNHLVYLADGRATHAIAFTTVNAKLWAENDDFRKYITSMIVKAQKTGDVGLGDKNYDLKSTFQEDAMSCWKRHNRTSNCEDYKSEKMKIVPDTRGERRELGLDTKASRRPGTSLCVFCPYHSVVMERARKAQGFY